MAQTDQSANSVETTWEFATTTGTTLPSSSFQGVTENLPSVLFTIDRGFQYFRIESKYLFASSEGVTIRRLHLLLKNYVEIFEVNYFWSLGVGMTQYKRNTNNYNDDGFNSSGGWQYAMGAKLKINKRLFFRAETGAYIRPGRSIYVGVGLGFILGGQSVESNN
ncbi:MAG: hypothetical protein KDD40_05080 [Bdellovibrionales bacterium]|nr:hypothetical protein [Bdellovibrionales bacterium]